MGAQTLGVLIDVPPPHAEALARWRRQVGDPMGSVIPPHVTLLPPTVVDADLETVHKHLDGACATVSPFEMHLSGTGTFRPVSDVVFVVVSRGIGECELLADAIQSGPLGRELEFPYHPHVTIAQDVDEVSLDAAYDGMSGFSARFTVAAVTLYRQAEDGSWAPVRTYPLTGPTRH